MQQYKYRLLNEKYTTQNSSCVNFRFSTGSKQFVYVLSEPAAEWFRHQYVTDWFGFGSMPRLLLCSKETKPLFFHCVSSMNEYILFNLRVCGKCEHFSAYNRRNHMHLSQVLEEFKWYKGPFLCNKHFSKI